MGVRSISRSFFQTRRCSGAVPHQRMQGRLASPSNRRGQNMFWTREQEGRSATPPPCPATRRRQKKFARRSVRPVPARYTRTWSAIRPRRRLRGDGAREPATIPAAKGANGGGLVIQDINEQLLPASFGVDAVVASRWFPDLPPGVFGGGRRWSHARNESGRDWVRYAFVDRRTCLRLALRRDAYRGGWWCSARFSASRVFCGGAHNSRPTSAADLRAVLEEVERVASCALGEPAQVGGWAVRIVEAFADVEVCWPALREALLKLSGGRRFVVRRRAADGAVMLRSSLRRSPWALVFYPKDEQERRVHGTASPWSSGRVRVEARAWTNPVVRRVAGEGSRDLASVLLGGDFAAFLEWALSRMGLGGEVGDRGGTLGEEAPGLRGRTRERLRGLLDAVGGRGWEAVLADPPSCYRDPAGIWRLRRDVKRLRALGLLLPGAAENALLGIVSRSVVDAARRHEDGRAADAAEAVPEADGEAPGVAESGLRSRVPLLSGFDVFFEGATPPASTAAGDAPREPRPP